jgi:hypothetical protein
VVVHSAMAACCWRSSRRGCWWQQWCFARCRCGAELHTDIAAANCELVGCQRRRRGALQLDLQPCSCTLRTPLRLHGSSTSQLSQLGATRPTAQVASYLMRRHRTARVGPSETCVQSAGSTVCGWGHAGRARTHYGGWTLGWKQNTGCREARPRAKLTSVIKSQTASRVT